MQGFPTFSKEHHRLARGCLPASASAVYRGSGCYTAENIFFFVASRVHRPPTPATDGKKLNFSFFLSRQADGEGITSVWGMKTRRPIIFYPATSRPFFPFATTDHIRRLGKGIHIQTTTDEGRRRRCLLGTDIQISHDSYGNTLRFLRGE